MKTNEYKLISMCVEVGTQLGVQRAYKHTDTPTQQVIEQCVYDAVMHEICEYCWFEVNND